MGTSFQEKSLWLMLVSLIVCSGLYFGAGLPSPSANVRPDQMVLFGLAVGLLVVLQIVGHLAIVVLDRRTQTDERDRLIGLKATRNAAYVLATGVFFALCAALWTSGNFVFTHVLLGSWVLAQLVETGSQPYLHRRGA